MIYYLTIFNRRNIGSFSVIITTKRSVLILTKNNLSDLIAPYMSPWLSLDDKDWEPILKDSSVKSYERSTVIYQQGDVTPYVYLVKEGRVVLDLYGINGRRRSIYIADKGPCFGELACLDQLGNYCTATTCTKTTLYLISKKRFTEEICQNPDFCMTLLKALSLKTRLITSLLEQMSFNDSNYRVYHSLLSLIQLYGVRLRDGSYKLNIKFTHQEMAYQTGLSRVSVSNIFLSLTNEGLIEKENGYLIVKDIQALKDYLIKDEWKEE